MSHIVWYARPHDTPTSYRASRVVGTDMGSTDKRAEAARVPCYPRFACPVGCEGSRHAGGDGAVRIFSIPVVHRSDKSSQISSKLVDRARETTSRLQYRECKLYDERLTRTEPSVEKEGELWSTDADSIPPEPQREGAVRQELAVRRNHGDAGPGKAEFRKRRIARAIIW